MDLGGDDDSKSIVDIIYDNSTKFIVETTTDFLNSFVASDLYNPQLVTLIKNTIESSNATQIGEDSGFGTVYMIKDTDTNADTDPASIVVKVQKICNVNMYIST